MNENERAVLRHYLASTIVNLENSSAKLKEQERQIQLVRRDVHKALAAVRESYDMLKDNNE